jgi:putative ABC transport system permease protein
MRISLPASQYRTKASMTAFYQRALGGVETVPEVKAGGAGEEVGMAEGLFIEGRDEPRPGEPRPSIHAVSEHYFEAMGLPILKGRAIARQDSADTTAVVVISEAIARHYWPNSDPIGRRIKLGNARSPWLTVAGVSGDVKDWFTGGPRPAAYLPLPQAPQPSASILVRTSADPMRVVNAVRGKVRAVDGNLPVFGVKSMEQTISDQLGGVRAAAASMATYAVIALLLAVSGIYAVISYSVVQRTHEIGIRMVLGAGRSTVLRMTLGQALRVALIGLSIGIPVAWAMARLMASALYNVVVVSPATFVILALILAASAVLAGYLPARRAARVDPMLALRHE